MLHFGTLNFDITVPLTLICSLFALVLDKLVDYDYNLKAFNFKDLIRFA